MICSQQNDSQRLSFVILELCFFASIGQNMHLAGIWVEAVRLKTTNSSKTCHASDCQQNDLKNKKPSCYVKKVVTISLSSPSEFSPT